VSGNGAANTGAAGDEAVAGTADGGAATAFQLKRGRLLRAAAACFNRKGYSGTSLRDVADQLGMTDAAIYYYVSGKQELVYECYLRAAEIGAATLARAVAEGGSGLDQARRYLGYHLEAMCGEEGPIAIMSEIPALAPRHREEILRRSRAHGRAFESILAQGIGDGSIAPCDVRMTGNAIMGAVNWVPKWFHGDPGVAARILAEFPAILTRGLAPR
jgi:AcrR family transcriptional regulator